MASARPGRARLPYLFASRERSLRLRPCRRGADQELPVDQRRSIGPEIRDLHLEILPDISLPDHLAGCRIEAEQESHSAKYIELAVLDDRCGCGAAMSLVAEHPLRIARLVVV